MKDWLIHLLIIMVVVTFIYGYELGLKSPASRQSIDTTKTERAIAETNQRLELLLTAQSIIMCESGGKHEVWGDKDHPYPAYGIGQFQARTFYQLAKESGMKGLKWKKAEDQLRLLLWAVDNGYAGLWTCYRRV